MKKTVLHSGSKCDPAVREFSKAVTAFQSETHIAFGLVDSIRFPEMAEDAGRRLEHCAGCPPPHPPSPNGWACARENGLCVCAFARPCASVRPCASGLSSSHTQTLSHTQTQAHFHFPPRSGAAGPGMTAAVATSPPRVHLCTHAQVPAPAGAIDGGAVSARVRGDGCRRPLRVQDDGGV